MRSPRIERIVIGVDFSEPSHAALEWTARSFPQAELTLVHCLDLPELPTFLARHADVRRRTLELAREGATERLATLAHALGDARVRAEVRDSPAVDGIVAAVRAANADLAVVAVTGRRLAGALRGHMGRTAERLARCSPAPVLLCTGTRREPPRRLLVALDESDITPHVLAWTRALAAHFEAQVTAVHVVSAAVLTHVLTAAAAGGAPDADLPPSVREEFRDDADGWIDAMLTAGLDPQRATSEVDFGEPAQEILAASERLDSELLILGSRGASALRRAVLGSVVSEVLRGAHCPVLVVVEPEDEIVDE